jgi:transcriptional regulator GlxA family with amidase domain
MSQRRQQLHPNLETAILVFDRVLLSSLGAFLDLSTAATKHVHQLYGAIDPIPEEQFDVFKVGLLSASSRRISSASGLVLAVDASIDAGRHYDLVILPAFELEPGAEQHTLASTRVYTWLQRQYRDGAVVAASGPSTLILGEAGLTQGRQIAVPWDLSAGFARRFPGCAIQHDQSISEDRRVFCSIGQGFDQALMLLLIERLVSPNLADCLSRKIGIDRHNQPLDRRAPVEQIFDPLVSHAQNWLQHRFPQAVTIADLAEALAVSRRTLSRRFAAATGMTPLGYLQNLRIESAKRMLQRRAFGMKRIASLIGYSDVRFFKRLFEAKTGMSPHAYQLAAKAKSH